MEWIRDELCACGARPELLVTRPMRLQAVEKIPSRSPGVCVHTAVLCLCVTLRDSALSLRRLFPDSAQERKDDILGLPLKTMFTLIIYIATFLSTLLHAVLRKEPRGALFLFMASVAAAANAFAVRSARSAFAALTPNQCLSSEARVKVTSWRRDQISASFPLAGLRVSSRRAQAARCAVKRALAQTVWLPIGQKVPTEFPRQIVVLAMSSISSVRRPGRSLQCQNVGDEAGRFPTLQDGETRVFPVLGKEKKKKKRERSW